MWAMRNNSLAQGSYRCSAARPIWSRPVKKHSIETRGTVKDALAPARQEIQSYEALWDTFAGHVQGEWEGVTVTFDAHGNPQPLPERFVPSAYREWGVELFDWQSQSSCVVSTAEGGSRTLRNIFKRLMPTVGCEADAIAYVEEAEDVWQADGGSPVKPVTAAGGYLAAPAQLPQSNGRVKVEACLAAPDGQSRLRATVFLMQHWESKEWQVMFVDLSREAYDGPFNGGVELSGCAGGGKPFAKDPVVALQELSGVWDATEVVSYARSGDDGALGLQSSAGPGPASVSSLAGPGAMQMPQGVWVGCKASQSDVALEVGVLRSSSARDVATCEFVEGRLSSVVFANEVRREA